MLGLTVKVTTMKKVMVGSIEVEYLSGLVVEYRTRNREVAGSTHIWCSASNLEQVANLLCAQANSA